MQTLACKSVAIAVLCLILLGPLAHGQSDWREYKKDGLEAFRRADYSTAEMLLRQALSIQQQKAPTALDTGRTVFQMAEVNRAQSKYADALFQYRQALVILAALPQNTATLGGQLIGTDIFVNNLLQNPANIPGSPDAAMVLNGMASLYRDHGQYYAAEPLYKRALEMCGTPGGASLGPLLGYDIGPLEIADVLMNYADFYRLQGRFHEAEPMYRRALTFEETGHGADRAALVPTLKKLAGYYRSEGRSSEAQDLEARIQALSGK